MKGKKDNFTLKDKEADLPGGKADDLDLDEDKDLLGEDSLGEDLLDENGLSAGEESESDGWDREIEDLEGKDDVLDDLEK